ncbi:MAG: hypothetical protein CMK59_11375 [Proteobacteria bacterium]|nr:hypothetical protein [Pseudomonadota bacterium]
MSEFRPFSDLLRENSKELQVSSEFQKITIRDEADPNKTHTPIGNQKNKGAESAFQPFVLTESQERDEGIQPIEAENHELPDVDALNQQISNLQAQVSDKQNKIKELQDKINELQAEKEKELQVHRAMVEAVDKANNELRLELREQLPDLLRLVVQTIMGSKPMMDEVLSSKINALDRELSQTQWMVKVHPEQLQIVEQEYIAHLERNSSQEEANTSWKVIGDDSLKLGEIVFISDEIEWQFLHKEIVKELEDDLSRWLSND